MSYEFGFAECYEMRFYNKCWGQAMSLTPIVINNS